MCAHWLCVTSFSEPHLTIKDNRRVKKLQDLANTLEAMTSAVDVTKADATMDSDKTFIFSLILEKIEGGASMVQTLNPYVLTYLTLSLTSLLNPRIHLLRSPLPSGVPFLLYRTNFHHK